MPEFVYIARDAHGQKVTGTLLAQTQREAISQLAGQALFPVEVTAEDQPTASRLRLPRRVSGQAIANTYAQLAALLRSGVPLLRSIAVLRDQTSHTGLKTILGDVHDRIEDGNSLGDAMARHGKVFGEMAVSMVRAGSEGGFLEEALERVATFTEQQEDLKSRTLGALAYPVFLCTVGSAVVIGLLVFFVPSFEELFARLRSRGELPLMTDLLLGLSRFMQRWGWIPLLALVAAFFYLRAQIATERGRLLFDQFKLRLPLVGPIFLSLAVARFCRVLGTLLRNGVPILKSLEISRQATGNRVLAEAIENATENISSGESLAAPLAASGRFPPTVVEMVSVAEESNTLDTVLTDIADSLERRTQRRLDLMVRLLEPVMLLILAGVVLVVVIALLLPILKMGGTLSS